MENKSTNRFCLGQVLFDPIERDVVLYGGIVTDESKLSRSEHILFENKTRGYEMVGRREYLPFKKKDGTTFFGHFARIYDLEKAFTGFLKSIEFDSALWGLVDHTIRFVGKPKPENIKINHVVIEELPGDINA